MAKTMLVGEETVTKLHSALQTEITKDVVKKADLAEFNAHVGNTTIHVTEAERSTWNNKADASKVYEKTDVNNLLSQKADLENGMVPASQLPSFVDDVLEYASSADFPTTGEAGKIYVALDTNLTYRWGGSTYVEISKSLALGETAETAYAGDKGKAAADEIAAHEARKDNPHDVTAEQVGAYTKKEIDNKGYLTSESDPVFTKWKDGEEVALGNFATASGIHAIAIGGSDGGAKDAAAKALGDECIAIGHNTSVNAPYATALGYGATASGMMSSALCTNANAQGDWTAALGPQALAEGSYSTAVGYSAYAKESEAVAFCAPPSSVYFGSTIYDKGATARSLQSYLDEKADATDLSDLSTKVSTLSAKVDDANAALEEVA